MLQNFVYAYGPRRKYAARVKFCCKIKINTAISNKFDIAAVILQPAAMYGPWIKNTGARIAACFCCKRMKNAARGPADL